MFEGPVENEYSVGTTDFKDKKEKKVFNRKLKFSFEDFVDKEGSVAAATGKRHEEDDENNCPPREQALQVVVIVCGSTGKSISSVSARRKYSHLMDIILQCFGAKFYE